MRFQLSTASVLVTLAACGSDPGPAPPSAEPVGTVAQAIPLPPYPAGTPIKRTLLGQNDWWEALPSSIWTVVGDSGVKLVRIGGNEQNVSPLSDSELLAQVDQVRAIGAEPLVQVSDRQSATEAAALVTWLNVDNARQVKLWAIGNEPDMEYDPEDEDEQQQLVDDVAATYISHAPAMRDVDSSIKIFGPGMAWYSETKYEALLGGDADITGTDAQGRPYIDIVDFHRYPFGSDTAGYSYSRADVINEMHVGFPNTVDALVDRIEYANDLHGRTGTSSELGWALTEYNVTWKNLAANTATDVGVCSFLNGQFFAEYLKVGMQRGAKTMATWSVREGGGDCSAGDLGFLGGTSNINPVKRSSYHHMKMMSDYLLTNVDGILESTSTQSLMRPIVTSRKSGQLLAVMILNEDTAAHTFSLSLDNGTTNGVGDSLIRVAAGRASAYSDSMPGQSTMVLIFNASGNVQKKVTYTVTDLQNGTAPLVQNFF